MGLSSWIPASSQFGEIDPAKARQGAMRQAVAQAIKHHLFAEDDPNSDAGSEYDRILLAFADKLCDFQAPATRPAAQSLWAALEVDGNQASERFEAVFCFAVHGLCAGLALHRVEALGATDDEDEDEEDGTATVPASEGLRAEYTYVLSAIAVLLRQAAWRWLRDDATDETSKTEDLRLVAATLLDALLMALSDWFTVETGLNESRNGRPHTPKHIVLRQRALAQQIDALLTELPSYFTVQPLKRPNAYQLDDRGPDDEEETDYFRVELIGYRRSNDFLRRLHAGMLRDEHRAPQFGRYLDAVNRQQAVPWRINSTLLDWAEHLRGIAGYPEDWGVAVADAMHSSHLDEPSLQSLRKWVREHFYQPAPAGGRKTIQRPGEFLDSLLAHRALNELRQLDDAGTPAAFYLPWKADYRGRIYAHTPWLTPQGGDLQRALFEFANGRLLDEHGVRALRQHGAILVRRSILLGDMGITDRRVVTLGERERWVEEHEEKIIASAASPLAEPFWREVASKPMQFLAFCLAYRQWKQNPEGPIHLPVQIDGTCNGLQHIAALTGDATLARAVNVLPSDDGLPGDIYTELATTAADSLGKLTYYKAADTMHRQGLELADAWLTASPRCDWINRDTAKKVVMTIPYGASQSAQARYVLEKIVDAFEERWRDDTPPLADLDQLLVWKQEKKNRWMFVAKCSRGLFEEQRKRAFSDKDELFRLLHHKQWEQMRTLAAYVALTIVRHLRAALTSLYPSADAFSQWLKETANSCAGLPLVWLTPLGLPVSQDKFKLKGSSVTARIGSQEVVRIDVQRLGESVDKDKQRDALLPNLIHSLDATHLAMTLREAERQGVTDIGSIHDCLLCHPNDAATVSRVVRDSFTQLYHTNGAGRPKPLADWYDWMVCVARLKDVPNAALLLGALDKPDGMGERLLRGIAADGDSQHRSALAVLETVRSLPPPQRFLARMLLEYLRDHGRPAAGGSMSLPAAGCLQIDKDTSLSDYFFS